MHTHLETINNNFSSYLLIAKKRIKSAYDHDCTRGTSSKESPTTGMSQRDPAKDKYMHMVTTHIGKL